MPHGLMSHDGNIGVLYQRSSASPFPEKEGAEMLCVVLHQPSRCQQALSCNAILWDLPAAPLCPVVHSIPLLQSDFNYFIAFASQDQSLLTASLALSWRNTASPSFTPRLTEQSLALVC